MKIKTVWVHERHTFEKEGREPIVSEGMHKKGEIGLGSMNFIMTALENGFVLKSTETWETIQERGVPKITGKFV